RVLALEDVQEAFGVTVEGLAGEALLLGTPGDIAVGPVEDSGGIGNAEFGGYAEHQGELLRATGGKVPVIAAVRPSFVHRHPQFFSLFEKVPLTARWEPVGRLTRRAPFREEGTCPQTGLTASGGFLLSAQAITSSA